ncbi:MAG: acetyl/propionyl/methylcrotonyl-CoA carboxylase subunit alpha [Breznakibacter sp.]
MTATNTRNIQTLFIPNRGEIAVRIIRSARRLGITTVVMLTHKEQHTLPAQLADAVALVPDGTPDKNYLNIPLIMACARQHHADALHPGYGYLSENEALALACRAEGLVFVGPSPEHLRCMGDKMQARQIARMAGVPLLPSLEGTPEELMEHNHALPYPILIKAAMGGGGKGMTIARHPGEWESAIRSAASQGERYFGHATVFAEQLLAGARHIEVQLLGDQHGNCIHLFDRECSVQRRYQKIIEEAPAPGLTNQQRDRITADALKIARQLGYYSAGTIEFLLDANGQHYFLEMNTRIQVEHPVTELVTGTDLVALQLQVAMGQKLPFSQQEVVCRGHAIESRLYAEDPQHDFRPSPGKIMVAEFPRSGRVETFFNGPVEILPQFDPMIAKIIHHADSREKVLALHLEALRDTHLIGIGHNIPFLIGILEHPDFVSGAIATDWLPQIGILPQESGLQLPDPVVAAYLWHKKQSTQQAGGWSSMGYWRMIPEVVVIWNQKRIHIQFRELDGQIHFGIGDLSLTLVAVQREGNRLVLDLDGKTETVVCHVDEHDFQVSWRGTTYVLTPPDWLQPYEPQIGKALMAGDQLQAPMPGTILNIPVKPGDAVERGDLLLVLEAMKMENHLTAWKDGVVDEIHAQKGENVKVNQILLTIL